MNVTGRRQSTIATAASTGAVVLAAGALALIIRAWSETVTDARFQRSA